MIPAVEQTSGTAAGGAGESSPTEEGQPAGAGAAGAEVRTSFASRGRARRRARYLRKARELAYRDLGGLVFNLHRFGQRNDQLVLAKLTTLQHIDGELRAIETALGESEPLTVLREAGITACPRCAAIHSSEDHFCPNCGLSLGPYAEHPAELRTGPAPGPVSAPSPAVAAPVEPAPPPAETPAPPPAAPLQPPAAEGPATAAQEQAATPPEAAPAPPVTRELEDEATVITRPSAPGR
jgi:hypothetical protein